MALASGMKLESENKNVPTGLEAEGEAPQCSALKRTRSSLVGPGTPMGDYLRRYWMPIGGASELDANPIKVVRLLGEDLVPL
jgi:hypothetical protein